MKFYLDTNIFLDLLLRRNPHLETAADIFDRGVRKDLKLYTSSHCIATVHYVCKKFFKAQLREVIGELLNFITVIAVDEEILRKSLNSQHKDFEDAIQILCAHQIKNLDAIITRNIKDFSTSEIEVFTPDQALTYIQKKK